MYSSTCTCTLHVLQYPTIIVHYSNTSTYCSTALLLYCSTALLVERGVDWVEQ
eukprot:COSAG02_NODE_934_length_15809_cov_59.853787_9_plen_53_part_00